MSIKDFAEKIKSFYLLFLFVVVAGVFFALGRLSAIEERHSPIKIIQQTSDQTANVISAEIPASGSVSSSEQAVSNQDINTAADTTGGEVVASKNGTKYYFPWCGIAGRIKDVNKVWFTSRADAEKAGYKPATNCHGLK